MSTYTLNDAEHYPKPWNCSNDCDSEIPTFPCLYDERTQLVSNSLCAEPGGDCCEAPPSAIKFDLIIDENTWVNANTNSSIDFSWVFGGDGSGGISAPRTCYRELLGVFLTNPAWDFAAFMSNLETFAQSYNRLSFVSGNKLTIYIPITSYDGASEIWNTYCGCDETQYWTPLTNFTDPSGNIDYTINIECCEDCNSTVNEDYTIIDVDVSNYINPGRSSWTLQFIENCDGENASLLFQYSYPGGIISIPDIIFNLLSNPTAAWTALEAAGAYWIYNENNPNSFRLVIPRNLTCCENSGVPESWIMVFSAVPPGQSVSITSVETTTCCEECLGEPVYPEQTTHIVVCRNGYTYGNLSQTNGENVGTITQNQCNYQYQIPEAGYYSFEMEYFKNACPEIVKTATTEFFVYPDCENCYNAILLEFNPDIELFTGNLDFEFSNLSSDFGVVTLSLNADTIAEITDMLETGTGIFTTVVNVNNISTFFAQIPCETCNKETSGYISNSVYINEYTTGKITTRCANT